MIFINFPLFWNIDHVFSWLVDNIPHRNTKTCKPSINIFYHSFFPTAITPTLHTWIRGVLGTGQVWVYFWGEPQGETQKLSKTCPSHRTPLIHVSDTKQKQSPMTRGMPDQVWWPFTIENGVFLHTVHQSFINWPLSRGYFGGRDTFQWPLPSWRGGRWREVKTKHEFMDCLPGPKKVAVVERWLL